MPILALRARELGADVSTAALIVALMGIGSLFASLPAGALVARIGERRVLTVGAPGRRRDGVGRPHRVGPRAGRRGHPQRDDLDGVPDGAAGLHDRRGPDAYRARAMSTLGGSMRVGVLIGPLLGAGLIRSAT